MPDVAIWRDIFWSFVEILLNYGEKRLEEHFPQKIFEFSKGMEKRRIIRMIEDF